MTDYFHIGAVNPETGRGGVEQFARDLNEALDGKLQYVTIHSGNSYPWEVALKENKKQVELGHFNADSVVIADGFYGLGLAGKVKRLVVVCHGCYAGWMREYAINPPPGYNARARGYYQKAADVQEMAYREGDLVAVSFSSCEDLYWTYKLKAHLIRNGIDLERYKPVEEPPEAWVEVAGQDARKGSDMIKTLRERGHGIERLGFEGLKEERWNRFKYAILPSRYEGGQYSALEAMATNKRIVAYNSGFFDLDVPANLIWGTYDFHYESFERLMREAENSDSTPDTRDWVDENASLEQFKKAWREFLDED